LCEGQEDDGLVQGEETLEEMRAHTHIEKVVEQTVEGLAGNHIWCESVPLRV
jgi:hypothetical protein